MLTLGRKDFEKPTATLRRLFRSARRSREYLVQYIPITSARRAFLKGLVEGAKAKATANSGHPLVPQPQFTEYANTRRLGRFYSLILDCLGSPGSVGKDKSPGPKTRRTKHERLRPDQPASRPSPQQPDEA